MRSDLKTERRCSNCGLVKIVRTRATPDVLPGVTFWRDGELVMMPGTPRCQPSEVTLA